MFQVGVAAAGTEAAFVPEVGRLPLRQWQERWGTEGAQALFSQQLAALGTVRDLINKGNIDCDLQDTGLLRVAHRPANVAGLETGS